MTDPPRVRATVIDLHCHVLPGIDDGPATIEDSIALARVAAAGGHARAGGDAARELALPQRRRDDRGLVGRAERASVRRAGRDPRWSAAGSPFRSRDRGDADRRARALAARAPGLGGAAVAAGRASVRARRPGPRRILLDLQRDGHHVVLAHPERCPAFHRDPRMLERLARAGVLMSVTAGSLDGPVRRRGTPFRARARARGDAPQRRLRRPRRRQPPSDDRHASSSARGSPRSAQWLTRDVPAAILDDGAIPSRPAVSRRERPLARRRAAALVAPATALSPHASLTMATIIPITHEHDDRDLHPDPGRVHGAPSVAPDYRVLIWQDAAAGPPEAFARSPPVRSFCARVCSPCAPGCGSRRAAESAMRPARSQRRPRPWAGSTSRGCIPARGPPKPTPRSRPRECCTRRSCAWRCRGRRCSRAAPTRWTRARSRSSTGSSAMRRRAASA